MEPEWNGMQSAGGARPVLEVEHYCSVERPPIQRHEALDARPAPAAAVVAAVRTQQARADQHARSVRHGKPSFASISY